MILPDRDLCANSRSRGVSDGLSAAHLRPLAPGYGTEDRASAAAFSEMVMT